MSLNNCEVIEGRALTGCVKNNVGGVKRVYIANHADVSSTTIEDGSQYTGSTIDQIVDIDMVSGKTFYIFDTVKETSSFTQSIESNIQNGTLSFTPTVELIFNKLDAKTRNLIQMLSVSLLDIIVVDSNDSYWYLGLVNGMDLTAAEMTSGVAQSDRNGSVLTFTGAEPQSIRSIYIDGTDGVITSDGVNIQINNVSITSY
jgi:hypothetical protein